MTQGTAAALLRNALRILDYERPDINVVAHTHDEIVIEVDEGRAAEGRAALMEVMTAVPEWAPGLPIAAEPTTWDWYTKCLG